MLANNTDNGPISSQEHVSITNHAILPSSTLSDAHVTGKEELSNDASFSRHREDFYGSVTGPSRLEIKKIPDTVLPFNVSEDIAT